MKQTTKMIAAIATPFFKVRPVSASNSVDTCVCSVREVSSGDSARGKPWFAAGAVEGFCGSCGCIGSSYHVRIGNCGGSAAQQAVHRGHKDQGREGREQQAADDRSAQGRVLLAAL